MGKIETKSKNKSKGLKGTGSKIVKMGAVSEEMHKKAGTAKRATVPRKASGGAGGGSGSGGGSGGSGGGGVAATHGDGPRAEVQARLKKGLLLLGPRVDDLLATWDNKSNGLVDKKAWRKALPSVGLDASRVDLDALFDSLDPEGSGSITYKDLYPALKQNAREEAALETAVARGEATPEAPEMNLSPSRAAKPADGAKKRALPSSQSQSQSQCQTQRQGFAASLAPGLAALLDQLSDKAGRCMALLGEWDEDATGAVLKQEFRRALPALGIRASREEAEELFDALDDTSAHAELLQHTELDRLLRGHAAMRDAAQKARGGRGQPRTGSKPKPKQTKQVPGLVSNAYSTLGLSSFSVAHGRTEAFAVGATDPLVRPSWDATAPLEKPRGASRAAAAAAAGRTTSAPPARAPPGNAVVAAAKREMAALEPTGMANAALSPLEEDDAADGAAEEEEEGEGIFLTSMGGAPSPLAAVSATARRQPAQRQRGGLALSESLPELGGPRRPKGGAFSKQPRLPPALQASMSGPGPGAYNLPAQGTGKQRRVRGVLAFGPARPQGGVGPEVLHLLQQQNEKITTALSRISNILIPTGCNPMQL